MIIFNLSLQSIRNRKSTALLTILSIALSVFLLLGVEKLRSGFKQSFLQTISGIDLIVGPRTSGTQLLLYAMFHIGNANNNVSIASLNELAARREVKWMVPISLGDSHRGFRVIGTTGDYFKHMKTIAGNHIEFSSGDNSIDHLEVVLGTSVAEKYNYNIGDEITLGHGTGEVSFIKHDREKFKVTGIMAATGLPIDQSLMVSLSSLEAMHNDWHPSKKLTSPEPSTIEIHEPEMISAAFFRLKSRVAILGFRQFVNQFKAEPLTAVIPGVAFAEIWRLISKAEIALLAVSALVAIIAIIGMVVTLLSSLNERRREMAILRSLGAKPINIFSLFIVESFVLSGLGIIIGSVTAYGVIWLVGDKVAKTVGLVLPLEAPAANEFIFIAIIFTMAFIGSIIPAISAYRMSLTDGLAIKV